MRTHSLIGRLLTVGALGVAVLAAAATPAAAAPDHGRPFHASLQVDVAAPAADGCEELSGTGFASHMGRITESGEACADGTGVSTWTAANGDTITFYFYTVPTGPPNADGSLPVEFVCYAIEGTGRFVDVDVDGALQALVYPAADGSAHLVAWLDSTIYYDASSRSSG